MTRPHIPEHRPPINVEWYVQRKRNVPVERNLLCTVTPTGSCTSRDQFRPYARRSWNLLTPRHFTNVPRGTVTLVGDQRTPIALTMTGVAYAGGARVTIKARTVGAMRPILRQCMLDATAISTP